LARRLTWGVCSAPVVLIPMALILLKVDRSSLEFAGRRVGLTTRRENPIVAQVMGVTVGEASWVELAFLVHEISIFTLGALQRKLDFTLVKTVAL
jgi:hypothetical protein